MSTRGRCARRPRTRRRVLRRVVRFGRDCRAHGPDGGAADDRPEQFEVVLPEPDLAEVVNHDQLERVAFETTGAHGGEPQREDLRLQHPAQEQQDDSPSGF
mgnify:CR=1 FL=1